jgi:hypothetical protein
MTFPPVTSALPAMVSPAIRTSSPRPIAGKRSLAAFFSDERKRFDCATRLAGSLAVGCDGEVTPSRAGEVGAGEGSTSRAYLFVSERGARIASSETISGGRSSVTTCQTMSSSTPR